MLANTFLGSAAKCLTTPIHSFRRSCLPDYNFHAKDAAQVSDLYVLLRAGGAYILVVEVKRCRRARDHRGRNTHGHGRTDRLCPLSIRGTANRNLAFLCGIMVLLPFLDICHPICSAVGACRSAAGPHHKVSEQIGGRPREGNDGRARIVRPLVVGHSPFTELGDQVA